MDYQKMWMLEKQRLRNLVLNDEDLELGDRKLSSWSAGAVLWLLDQIEMEVYFGEDVSESKA